MEMTRGMGGDKGRGGDGKGGGGGDGKGGGGGDGKGGGGGDGKERCEVRDGKDRRKWEGEGDGGGGIALNSCAVAIVQFESLVQQFISTGDVHRLLVL